MQVKAADQLATHPVCPSYWSSDHLGVFGQYEGQASRWDRLQHDHLLPREHQGIPCPCCHCPASHQPERTWRAVQEASQDNWQVGWDSRESSEAEWAQGFEFLGGSGGLQVGAQPDPRDAQRSPEGSQHGCCQDVQASEEPPVCDLQTQ